MAHVHDLQYKEGVEIFAVQCETIQQAAIADNISSLRMFIDDGDIDTQVRAFLLAARIRRS